ncbi:cytochrome P450 [Intrasporangium sp.]|uniref:cytochrome P450 n=1 Tax=Intrasporangium sp. TaxID=1925024 RepID=UPI00322154BD
MTERTGLDTREIDWDPRAPEVLADQVAAYDAMRAQCPIAYGAQHNWTVFGHADTVRILDDPAGFSNVVSAYPAVPNGMDEPRHRPYRQIVDRYFTAERLAHFEPHCRALAHSVVGDLRVPGQVEVMSALAEPFANAVTCGFMGWPDSLREPLREWTGKNHRATLSMDRQAMHAVALEFDGYIREQLDLRRADGADPDDVTAALLTERVDGRPLDDAEIVAIVRNWTVGELGTIAASVGIIVEFLATHPEVQDRLRADRSLLVAATDEILRIHAPLISNRRRTTGEVTIAGRKIPAEERVIVLWASANRDERVFGDPDEFRLDRDPADNLLYGRGLHDCPGAPLARLELHEVLDALFDATSRIEPAPGTERTLATYPASGFATVTVRLG